MAKREYVHLSLSERDIITTMLAEKKPLGAIAKCLGRSKSTLACEVQRNSSPEYRLYLSHRAHGRAEQRKSLANTHKRLKDEKIEFCVRSGLHQSCSSELISGRIHIDQPGLSISHEAIYQYIYHPDTEGRQELIEYLRRGHRRRKSKGIGRKVRKTKIPNRVPIDHRPVSVETRSKFGHWEGDSLVSRKSLAALNSLVERKSRYLLLTKIAAKTVEATCSAIIGRLKGLPQKNRRTLTLDNGTENAKHKSVTAAIGTQCYFANPYASWQR